MDDFKEWANRTETLEGAWIVAFAISLALAGLADKSGAWWFLPVGIVLAVGFVWAVVSKRY